MNAVVPCPWLDILTVTVVTRVDPKPAIMARSGVESEIKMFGLEEGGFVIEPFVRIMTLTALMSPCATPQLCRYLTPLITSKS